MKLVNFIFIASMLLLFACSNSTAEQSNTKKQAEVAPTTSNENTTNTTKASQPKDDRATLEGFWTLFKDAVLENDTKKVEALCANGVLEKCDFFAEENKSKIVDSNTEDLEAVEGQEATYKFTMLFEYDDVESMVVLFIKKNAEGQFEIAEVAIMG